MREDVIENETKLEPDQISPPKGMIYFKNRLDWDASLLLEQLWAKIIGSFRYRIVKRSDKISKDPIRSFSLRQKSIQSQKETIRRHWRKLSDT